MMVSFHPLKSRLQSLHSFPAPHTPVPASPPEASARRQYTDRNARRATDIPRRICRRHRSACLRPARLRRACRCRRWRALFRAREKARCACSGASRICRRPRQARWKHTLFRMAWIANPRYVVFNSGAVPVPLFRGHAAASALNLCCTCHSVFAPWYRRKGMPQYLQPNTSSFLTSFTLRLTSFQTLDFETGSINIRFTRTSYIQSARVLIGLPFFPNFPIDQFAQRLDHIFEPEMQDNLFEESVHDHLLSLKLSQAARHQIK